MEQHPVPQQVSSYQFKLVGDMTLKQFFQIAGGALISLLFYASPLHPLIKWPFILFFALLGIALAFLPFEERPLETWIAALFRSIYSPTQYYWNPVKTHLSFFKEDPGVKAHPVAKPTTPLDAKEQEYLAKIATLAKNQPLPAQPVQASPMNLPQSAPVNVFQQGFRPTFIVEERVTRSQPVVPNFTPTAVGQTVVARRTQYSGAAGAVFSTDAAPPFPPSQPNTIVGQVLDPEGKIVESAILEVQDSSGRPVRALRSNRAGHFLVVTPLSPGSYQLTTEKEGLIFDPVSFEANNELIPSILVKAKGRLMKAEIVN